MFDKLKEKLSPDHSDQDPSKVKKKQMFVFSIVMLVFCAVIFLIVVLTDDAKPAAVPVSNIKRKAVGETTMKLPAVAEPTDQDAWKATAGDQVRELLKDKEETNQRLKRMEEALAKSQEANANALKLPPAGALPMPPQSGLPSGTPPGLPGANAAQQMQAPPIAKKGIVTTDITSKEEKLQSGLNSTLAPNERSPVAISAPNVSKPAAAPTAVGQTPQAAVQAAAKADSATVVDKAIDIKNKVTGSKRNYIPPGAFFRSVMLASLDAPSSDSSKANPHPVLLRVTDHAVLPNQFAGQIRECFIIASGYGDLSSERAYLRTETLSCVSKKGRAMDVPISGWVIGEDGKAGMRGRLVSKQGQALASAMATAALSGLSNVVSASATVTTQSALGTTTSTPSSGAAFRQAMGEGAAKGIDQLTKYYLSLAEKLFPVIEIDSGRTVDIALNKGLDLGNLFEEFFKEEGSDYSDDLTLLNSKNRQSAPRKSIVN